MLVIDALQTEAQQVAMPGAQGVQIQWLLDETHGAPTFAMRRFVLGPGGQTPLHTHDWEHEVYVISGEGMVVSHDEEHNLTPDLALIIPAGEQHQFRSTGPEPLVFLCMVPLGPATSR